MDNFDHERAMKPWAIIVLFTGWLFVLLVLVGFAVDGMW